MPTTLPRPLVNRLLAVAQSDPERESCGLVSTKNGAPSRFYPVGNVAAEPGRLFQMDPEGQIDAMRTMREMDEELFAIYHSHPHAPAAPSALDIEQAEYPEALYLIVSLDTKGVLEMRGYRIEDGEAREEALELQMD